MIFSILFFMSVMAGAMVDDVSSANMMSIWHPDGWQFIPWRLVVAQFMSCVMVFLMMSRKLFVMMFWRLTF